MKKLLTIFSFLLLCNFLYATAPSMTNVTATLTDTSTQVWTNGSWQAAFQTPFGNPNAPQNNGNPVIQRYSGVLDGTGTFTVSLDDNNVVTPSGSHWVFTLCPNATVPVCSNATVLVTGASQDLSATLSAALTVPVVQSKPTIYRAYNDTEAFGGLGALYVRTNDSSLRLCNTPTGCPGSGWTAASVPSANPIFTGTVQINGDLNVTGLSTLTNLLVTNNSEFQNQVKVDNCIEFQFAALQFTNLCPQAGGPFSVNLPASSGTLLTDTTLFPLFAPDGDVAHPQYSWTSEHGLGFYRNGTGVLNVASGGNTELSLQNGAILLPVGGQVCMGSTAEAGFDCEGAIGFDHAQQLWGITDAAGIGTLNVSHLRLTASPSAGQTGINFTTSADYLMSSIEQSTPSTPAATFSLLYSKLNNGYCSVDSAGIERCMVVPSIVNQAVQAASTTNLGGDVGVSANTTTTVITHAVTMPSTGCPCRVFAAYNVYALSGAGLTTTGWVTDGTNEFATSLSTASGSSVNYAYTGSSFTPVTYANGASATFVMKVFSSDATTAKKDPPLGAPTQVSYLNLVVMTSN